MRFLRPVLRTLQSRPLGHTDSSHTDGGLVPQAKLACASISSYRMWDIYPSQFGRAVVRSPVFVRHFVTPGMRPQAILHRLFFPTCLLALSTPSVTCTKGTNSD